VKTQGVYRNANIPFMGAGLAIVGVVLAVVTIGAKHGQVAAAGIALLTVACGIRVTRAGIWVGPSGVTVVALLLGRRKASWAEVDHFEARPTGVYPAVAYVVLKDGRAYRSMAIGSSTRINPRVANASSKVQDIVDQLTRVLEHYEEVPPEVLPRAS